MANTLGLDEGAFSIANLTFRQEVFVPIGADFVADTNTRLSLRRVLFVSRSKARPMHLTVAQVVSLGSAARQKMG